MNTLQDAKARIQAVKDRLNEPMQRIADVKGLMASTTAVATNDTAKSNEKYCYFIGNLETEINDLKKYVWTTGGNTGTYLGNKVVIPANKNTLYFFKNNVHQRTIILNSDMGIKYCCVAIEGGFVTQSRNEYWIKENLGFYTGLKSGNSITVRETFSGLSTISCVIENRVKVTNPTAVESFGTDNKTFASVINKDGQFQSKAKIPNFYNEVFAKDGWAESYGLLVLNEYLYDVYLAVINNNAATFLNSKYKSDTYDATKLYAFAHIKETVSLLFDEIIVPANYNTLILKLCTADWIS